MQLVLASTSPHRKILLERFGLPFEVANPDIDESLHVNEQVSDAVQRLALEKAQAVAKQFPHALIIGSDEVGVHGKEILTKPHTHENAVKQLQAMSGKKLTFYTGLCLLNTNTQNVQVIVESYYVYMRDLSLSEIENYLHKEKPYFCAGSLQVEGMGIALIEKLEGNDPNALIGLPLIKLAEMLRQENVRVV